MAYICVHPHFLVSSREKEQKKFENERMVVGFLVAGVGRVTSSHSLREVIKCVFLLKTYFKTPVGKMLHVILRCCNTFWASF